MAAQISNDDGKPVLFCGVPGEADRQRTQLSGVLTGLGMIEVRRFRSLGQNPGRIS
jgi:hypothetical protein